MSEQVIAEITQNLIEAEIVNNQINVEVIVGGSGGVGNWGGIGGNIIDQLDLIDLLGDYVPYTGATADLDLGDNKLSFGVGDKVPYIGKGGVNEIEISNTTGTLALLNFNNSRAETWIFDASYAGTIAVVGMNISGFSNDAGYVTTGEVPDYEEDPVYTSSSWYTTTNNSNNWNTAYGWGNHASAGYLTTETNASAVILAPLTGVRNTIISQTATSVGLIIKNHASQSVPNFILQRSNGVTTTHFKIGGQLQINADPNSAPVASDDTYIASLQNTNSIYSFLEILNNGGTGKGCFFGLEGDEFNQYNWQGAGIGFFTATIASDGNLRLRIENNGNIGLYSPSKWAWGSGWGGGVGVVALGNATTAPTTSLTNCLALYSVASELYFMSTGNTVRKVATLNATETFTNKRITKRVGTTASSATPTPNADTTDQYNVTALAVNATFGSPTGTPTDGQDLTIRIKDNGTARTLAFNAIYRAIGVTLPTSTVISKTMYLGAKYNSADSKWDVLAVGIEA